MGTAKEKILQDYNEKLESWEKAEVPVKDYSDLKMEEAFIIIVSLHSSNKKLSREITAKLFRYLVKNRISSINDMRGEINISQPVLNRRLNILRKHGLVRKVDKYFLATPRLDFFVKDFMGYLVK